jgi:hypothetical protein
MRSIQVKFHIYSLKRCNFYLKNLFFSQGEVRYCTECSQIKPDRCHHCSVCGECVLKMDHHCPWVKKCFQIMEFRITFNGDQTVFQVNNCVAFQNYKFFILFLGYALTYCIYVSCSTMKYFLLFWSSDVSKNYGRYVSFGA